MPKQVTLSLGDDSARLLVIDKRRVVSWVSTPLSPGFSASDPKDAGQQIRSLLQAAGAKAHRARVIVEVHSPAVLTRHLTLPRMPRRYVPKVVTSELKDAIPFPIDEVDISWEASRNGKGWHVLAFCIPSDVIDRQMQALKAASVRSIVVYPRPVALAHAVAERDAVILNLEPSGADIVPVVHGVPRAIYQSRTRFNNGDRQEALQTLAAEVERLVHSDHCAETEDTGKMGVVVTGKLADQELADSLAKLLPRAVKLFKPAYACPDGFPAAEYAANLGLAQAAGSRASFPSINVLPARHRPGPLPLKQIATFGLLLALVAFAALLSRQVAAQGAAADAVSTHLSSLQSMANQQRLHLNDISTMQQDIQRTQTFTQQMNAQFQQLAASRSSFMRDVQTAAVDAVPQGVSLVSISYGAGKLGIQAQSQDYYQALQYTDQLKSSGLFQKVSLERAQGTDKGISFQITAVY